MRKTHSLTAAKIKNITKPGYYADGAGLYLQVTSKGAKSWVYRFMLNNRRRDMGLGSLQAIGLSEARAVRADQQRLLTQGIDPIEHRKASKAEHLIKLAKASNENITFSQCAEEYINLKASEWRSSKSKQQWSNTMRDYVYPVMGSLPVSKISQEEVLKALNPIWNKKTETAKRVRQRIEAVLDYAKAKFYREGHNPAAWKGGLEPILPSPNKIKNVQHHKALNYEGLPSFMTQLRAQDSLGARALEFLILTCSRTGDVRGAKWDEIDFKKKIWIIPKERMKIGEEHRVPLCLEAISLLEALPRLEEFIFPGQKAGSCLSNGAMSAVLRRMDYLDRATVHGFRTTFRTWAAEVTNYPWEICEMALAHRVGNETERAYQRGDLIEKRIQMMKAWASYCDLQDAKIIRLPA
ncbi:MAG: integrase [Cellvibrionales bacterium]|nr:integrase [Cellvibrionales bacterium]